MLTPCLPHEEIGDDQNDVVASGVVDIISTMACCRIIIDALGLIVALGQSGLVAHSLEVLVESLNDPFFFSFNWHHCQVGDWLCYSPLSIMDCWFQNPTLKVVSNPVVCSVILQ